MVELGLIEIQNINGGATASTVLTGAGVVCIGVACMVAAPTVTIAAAGYALYNVGAIGVILGVCDL